MIRMRDVSYTTERGTVGGIDFRLAAGETAVIHGPHYSGKTVFAEVCVGLYPHDGGEMSLLGEPVAAHEKRFHPGEAQDIGIVTQYVTLMDNMTVTANVGLPVSYHLGLDDADMRRRVEPMLDSFGIRHLGGKFPHEISETDAKLAMMARAVIMDPRLLVLDEPMTGNLDPGGFMRIMEAMNLLRGQGKAMLISTSSPSLASLKGASVYYLVDGALIPHGRARETLSRAAEGFFRQIRQYTDRQQMETLEFYRTTLPGGER